MPKETTKIYIRRGKNGYKYAAYTASGDFIGNLEHLRDCLVHNKNTQNCRGASSKLQREFPQ